MEYELRETADARRSSSAALRSLRRYVRRKLNILDRAIGLGEQEIAAGRGNGAETVESVRQLRLDRANLLAGWKNRSLRDPDDDELESRVEQRSLATAPPAYRAPDTGTSTVRTARQIRGYAAIFDVTTVIWTPFGEFLESLAPGCFTTALQRSDCRCLYNHDSNMIFGRTSAHTLELQQNSRGLYFMAYLLGFDPQSYALARRIDRRDLSGCSFTFTDNEDKDEWSLPPRGGLARRVIHDITELYDVGPVTYPAYKQTSVEAIFEDLPARSAVRAPAAEPPWGPDDEAFDDWYDNQLVAEDKLRLQRPISKQRQQQLTEQLQSLRAEIAEGIARAKRIEQYGFHRLSRS